LQAGYSGLFNSGFSFSCLGQGPVACKESAFTLLRLARWRSLETITPVGCLAHLPREMGGKQPSTASTICQTGDSFYS
jgi:hypothetical protein